MQPPSTSGRPAPELRDYLTTLRLRKWWVIGTVLLVVAVAVLSTYLQTPVYTSETQVLVEMPQTAAAQLGQPPTPDMATEQALATSTSVAAAVASQLGVDETPTQLLRQVSVTVPRDTQLLQFTFTDTQPEAASRGAAAFEQVYLQMRRQRFDEGVQALVTPIEEQIHRLRRALRTTQAHASATNDPARRTALTNRADSLLTQIGLLQQRRRDISSVVDLSVGQVVEQAEVPSAPSNRRLLPTIVLAIAVGLILGIAAALIRERLDDRLRSEKEVEARSGAPTLATVPRIDVGMSEPHLLDGSASSPPLLLDAFRSLRTSLLFTLRGADTRVVLVTSPEGGDGKTTVAANLGASLAHAGDRVVIVAADLRRPASSGIFAVDGEQGLTAVLREEVDVGSAPVETNVPNLTIIPTGPIEPDDLELLRPDHLRDVFYRLARDHDLVLVDGPPVLGVPDTLALAAATDATLLVVDAKRTTKATIERAIRQLALVDAVVLGEVVNNLTPSDFGHYASTDGYGSILAQPSYAAGSANGDRDDGRATPAG